MIIVKGHVGRWNKSEWAGMPPYYFVLTGKGNKSLDEIFSQHVNDQVVMIFEDSKKDFDD